MKNFNKILLLIIVTAYSFSIKANEVEKVLFSIDTISYTSIDLNNRKKYIDLIRDRGLEKKNNLFYLNDLISVLLFDLEYKRLNYQNNELNKLINEFYDKAKFDKINSILTDEKIKENIRYDFQKKILLENLLDTQKDIIFERNKEELTEIYQINLEYFSFNNKNHNFLKKILKELNFLNILDKKENLKKEKIKYIYSNKEIRFNNVVNKKIKDIIKKNRKYFNIKINENIYIYGKITKKLKIDKELRFTLVQIIKKNDGNDLQANCNSINEIKKNKNIDVKIIDNIDYYKLNQTIKENLYSLNDKIIIKNDNQENHIILCDIKYNKDDVKKINIDNRVNYLVSKIEEEFIKIKKEEFVFNIYD